MPPGEGLVAEDCALTKGVDGVADARARGVRDLLVVVEEDTAALPRESEVQLDRLAVVVAVEEGQVEGQGFDENLLLAIVRDGQRHDVRGLGDLQDFPDGGEADDIEGDDPRGHQAEESGADAEVGADLEDDARLEGADSFELPDEVVRAPVGRGGEFEDARPERRFEAGEKRQDLIFRNTSAV